MEDSLITIQGLGGMNEAREDASEYSRTPYTFATCSLRDENLALIKKILSSFETMEPNLIKEEMLRNK